MWYMPSGLPGRVAYYRSEFTGRMDKIIESNLSVTEKQDIEIHLKRNGKHRSSGRARGKWDEVKVLHPKIAEKHISPKLFTSIFLSISMGIFLSLCLVWFIETYNNKFDTENVEF